MSGFNNLSQNVFGLTALVVSLVALVTTTVQVLQQIFSSAEGYRRCAWRVMGDWAEGTHRKLRWKELRVEVIYETPVIFTSKLSNDKGPIKNEKIHYIDGTEDSYKNTRVAPPTKEERTKQSRVHTVHDERASWLTLISTLQDLERMSRLWDLKQRTNSPPRNSQASLASSKKPEYELTVGLQRKTRSWDFIPSSITKPYATSAICHLVEMMAMLGVFWKVFDQSIWNLRAEGNGFILTSTSIHGLGVMVSFATTGKADFEDKRVIPCHATKELTFGRVPNIFDNIGYLTNQAAAQSIDLVFGAQEDVSATLESLGCSAETMRQFEKDHKHIFSVSFEIIGMLAKVFRIRGSSFRMLPNPTADHWLKKIGQKASWKITTLMSVFKKNMKDHLDSESYPDGHEIEKMSKAWTEITDLGCEDEANLSLEAREKIHDALDSRTKYLLSVQQLDVLNVLVSHLTKVMEILDDPNSPLNTIVLANKEDALISHYFHEIRPSVIGNLDSNKKPLTREHKEMRNTIWLSLIFRMLLWLLLHDFDTADIKIVPFNLRGSRMPIYIG